MGNGKGCTLITPGKGCTLMTPGKGCELMTPGKGCTFMTSGSGGWGCPFFGVGCKLTVQSSCKLSVPLMLLMLMLFNRSIYRRSMACCKLLQARTCWGGNRLFCLEGCAASPWRSRRQLCVMHTSIFPPLSSSAMAPRSTVGPRRGARLGNRWAGAAILPPICTIMNQNNSLTSAHLRVWWDVHSFICHGRGYWVRVADAALQDAARQCACITLLFFGREGDSRSQGIAE